MYSSVALITFMMLCNHYFCLVPKHFHHPQRIPHSRFPSLHPLATINLLFVSVDLPILDNTYKWNHIICDLLCLAYFTCIMFSKLIHFVGCISTSFLFVAK